MPAQYLSGAARRASVLKGILNMNRGNTSLRLLFIGNSHTYYNDMPTLVDHMAREDDYICSVTMLAHPGWYLEQHAAEPEARFNILYGRYDYVVLQEHAHPFGPEKKFLDAALTLNTMIRSAGSIPVIYECWSRKSEPEKQRHMNEVHRQVAGRIGALIAPVGEYWWDHQQNCPAVEMYASDGEHASVSGSEFAAQKIWDTIRSSFERGTA